jgi:hypothetical protein
VEGRAKQHASEAACERSSMREKQHASEAACERSSMRAKQHASEAACERSSMRAKQHTHQASTKEGGRLGAVRAPLQSVSQAPGAAELSICDRAQKQGELGGLPPTARDFARFCRRSAAAARSLDRVRALDSARFCSRSAAAARSLGGVQALDSALFCSRRAAATRARTSEIKRSGGVGCSHARSLLPPAPLAQKKKVVGQLYLL